MPIYEFDCQECHDQFEQIMSFSATEAPLCPVCGSARTERRVSAPAIHFRGSGFYLTESRKENEAAKEKGKAEKEGDTKNGDAKKDQKTEAKEKSKPAEGKAREGGATSKSPAKES